MDNRRTKERHVIKKIYELKSEIQNITNELEDPYPRFPINELYELKADLKKLKEIERRYILKLREINPQSSVLRNTLQIHNSTILLNEEEEKVYPFELQYQNQEQQMYNNLSVFGKSNKMSKSKRKAKNRGKASAKHEGKAPAKHEGKAPAKHEGKASAKHEGKAPAKHKGKASAKRKGKGSIKGKGKKLSKTSKKKKK